jgi:hypothetical protein
MSQPPDDGHAEVPAPHARRERSTRYPGANLAESLKLVESIETLGLDGLTAEAIAAALGYKNIKTNTFSARMSAARQFGLLSLKGEGYALTPLSRTILHPVDPVEQPRLFRQALLKPPLYADLAKRLGGKRLPDVEILANVLYHNHQIIASAKRTAAVAFLESARFAQAVGADEVFLPDGPPTRPAPRPAPPPKADAARAEVRLDLSLWDRDDGKTIRLRAPRSISAASFERFLQAFRLLVKVEE